MTDTNTAIQHLRKAGEQADDEINLIETALNLALLHSPAQSLHPYHDHLAAITADVRALGDAHNAQDRQKHLRQILVTKYGYDGNNENYDDQENANLMKVIDRRKGLPVALGIIYLHVAESCGWPMAGLNFPGHFFVRMEGTDGDLILDPFRAGQTCRPEELPIFLPSEFALEDDETFESMNPEFTSTVSKRDVLLRLQNNIKRRHLVANNIELAISTLQTMILFAPRRAYLWRELGGLQAEQGTLNAALTSLNVVLNLDAEPESLMETESAILKVKRQIQ